MIVVVASPLLTKITIKIWINMVMAGPIAVL